MRDIGAEMTGRRQSDQRVEIGAVDVHLPAVRVHDRADLGNAFLEHAVRRGIGHHQRGEFGAVLCGPGAQILDIDVAAIVALDDHHAQAGEHRAGRIGAVRGRGDEADCAAGLAAAGVVALDGQQPGVFPLRAGVGLERHRRVPRALHEHAFQVLKQRAVTGGLPLGGEGMQPGEALPAQGQHLGGGIELHGATAQGNHAPVEGDVLVFEVAQVAQHFGLGVILVEQRMLKIIQRPLQRLGDGAGGVRLNVGIVAVEFCVLDAEYAQQRGEVGPRGGLVQGHAQAIVAIAAQIDPRGLGALQNARALIPRHDTQRVEELRMRQAQAALLQRRGQHAGQPVAALGDAAQAARPVVHGVEGRHHGQQRLRRADIAAGFFTAYVLLARLHGHAQGRASVAIDGDADNAPGSGALVGGAGGEEGRVGAAVTHGHTEALTAAHHHIGAQIARGAQHQQREQVAGDGDPRVLAMRSFDKGGRIAQPAAARRVLQEQAEALAPLQQLRRLAGDDLDTQRPRAGFEHRQGLRMAIRIDQKARTCVALVDTFEQGHGLGRRGGLVEHGGVGKLHAGQVHHQLLVGQQRLQTALGNLRLIGRVGGVPARIFQHVALDDGGGVGAVVAHADKAAADAVAPGKLTQPCQHIDFPLRSAQVHGPAAPYPLGHGGVDQGLRALITQRQRHFLLLGRCGADMTGQKFIVPLQGAQSQRGGGRRGGCRGGRGSDRGGCHHDARAVAGWGTLG